jgi:NADPH-dependent curcumin reductase CurA
MAQLMNNLFRLIKRPQGNSVSDNFAFTQESVVEPEANEVLVRVNYLSLDPTNRIWMSDIPQYMEPVGLGEVMRGIGIGTVQESRSKLFKKGDLVSGLLGWQEFATLPESALSPLPGIDAPMAAHLGPLGMTGLTAYFGLLTIGDPKPGETVVVSAAAGAVGSIVGQIAKIRGCHVVGLAGSAEKCRWLTEELGFDSAINYKTENLGSALDRHCPKGIDVYFENVGGETLDEVLKRVNLFARIPLCGLISGYNTQKPLPGPYQFSQLLMKRVKLQGFIVFDFAKEFDKATKELGRWVQEGRIKYRSTVVKGLEKAPDALNMLFNGDNTGKLYIEVCSQS